MGPAPNLQEPNNCLDAQFRADRNSLHRPTKHALDQQHRKESRLHDLAGTWDHESSCATKSVDQPSPILIRRFTTGSAKKLAKWNDIKLSCHKLRRHILGSPEPSNRASRGRTQPEHRRARSPFCLAVLRSPSDLLVPSRRPLVASLGEVSTLLQLLSLQVARHQSATLSIHSIDEVLTSHANTGALPAAELLLINESPVLQASPKIVLMY